MLSRVGNKYICTGCYLDIIGLSWGLWTRHVNPDIEPPLSISLAVLIIPLYWHDISWCFMMFHDVSWCVMIFHDVSWCCMTFQGLLSPSLPSIQPSHFWYISMGDLSYFLTRRKVRKPQISTGAAAATPTAASPGCGPMFLGSSKLEDFKIMSWWMETEINLQYPSAPCMVYWPTTGVIFSRASVGQYSRHGTNWVFQYLPSGKQI